MTDGVPNRTAPEIELLALEAGIAITAAGMVIDGEYGGLHVRKLSRFAAIVQAAALEAVAARQAADEAVAAGDGTLHGAIDHWHGVALAAQAQAAAVSEERDELRAACERVLGLLHEGAPGWGVSKDILAHVLLHRRRPG